jgi:hypothetical protein
MNVDPLVYTNRLGFASNIPAPTPCTPGGTSWINYVDAVNGCAIDETGIAGNYNETALTNGLSAIEITDVNGNKKGWLVTPGVKTPLPPPPLTPYGKRVGWRTLTN